MNIRESITLPRVVTIPRIATIIGKETLTNPTDFDLWKAFDWKRIKARVNKLMLRIAEGAKRGAMHLVKRLQYLLTNSYYAKLLTVKKVTENKGKKTSGVDKKRWLTAQSKLMGALSLNCKGYKAKPLKRIFIPKKNGKKRPLGIPTMKDRAMQALLAMALEPVAEVTADKRSFGFRKYRSCADVGQQLFYCLHSKGGAKWILEGDIKGCFDNISHNWLMKNIPMNKGALGQFLKAGFISGNRLFGTEKGTPQGGIISPILANMTLDGIEDILLKKYWTSSTGKVHAQYNKDNVNFIRYADDFIVTAGTKVVAKEVQKIIKEFLLERGLELSKEKTRITRIEDGFDFLGWNIRKYKGRREKGGKAGKRILLITPSKESLKSVCDKIREMISSRKTEPQNQLITVLNPVVRGWCNYHRSICSKESFKTLDSVLFLSLWKWARRRHPMKSKAWVRKKYFKQNGLRNWIFTDETVKLICASDTKIRRHVMINLNKNPYLRADREYYRMREEKKKSFKYNYRPYTQKYGSMMA